MDEMWAHVPIAAALLILGLFCIRPFFAWLNRVKSVRHGDTSLELSARVAEQQANSATTVSGEGLLATSAAVITSSGSSPPVPSADAARGDILRNLGVSPLVIERERAIFRDLNNVQDGEKINLLVRHLAIASMFLIAEQTYRLIFGSQLAMVEYLNLYGPTPKAKLLALFYDPAAAKFPEAYANIPAAGWLQFPVTSGLMVSQNDDQYAITQTGKAFLEWIVATGILASKQF
jgi:hypothetical protein